MRLATIDCGTNTVLMLVADVARGPGGPLITAVEDRLAITRLGEGLDQSGELKEEAMARSLQALRDHAARARELGAERVVAIGTESLRAARNGADYLGRAAAAGVPIRVISGDEEARLSWRAAESARPLGPGQARSVLDIGGGSTELIIGTGHGGASRGGPGAWRSVPIGSVRLTERHLRHDPPLPAERQALRETVERALDDLPPPRGELVGVAGTVTTVAAMHLQMDDYDGDRIEGARLPAAALRTLVERLGETAVSERRHLRGLDPRRADVIYAGAVILLAVCERARAQDVIVSGRGVRWGALLDLADELADGLSDEPGAAPTQGS